MMLHYTLLRKARKNSSEHTQNSKTEETEILRERKTSRLRKSEIFSKTNAGFHLDFRVQRQRFLQLPAGGR